MIGARHIPMIIAITAPPIMGKHFPKYDAGTAIKRQVRSPIQDFKNHVFIVHSSSLFANIRNRLV
jgi:hypothetical protein